MSRKEVNRVVAFNPKTGKKNVKTFSSEAKMERYHKIQMPQALDRLRNLPRRGIPNLTDLANEMQNLDLDWEDTNLRGQEGECDDLLGEARRILREAGGAHHPPRTNAQNREQLALNWAKVRSLMLEILTGRQPNSCECPDRRPMSIQVISLNGEPLITPGFHISSTNNPMQIFKHSNINIASVGKRVQNFSINKFSLQNLCGPQLFSKLVSFSCYMNKFVTVLVAFIPGLGVCEVICSSIIRVISLISIVRYVIMEFI